VAIPDSELSAHERQANGAQAAHEFAVPADNDVSDE
jgi:hypothetical protein